MNGARESISFFFLALIDGRCVLTNLQKAYVFDEKSSKMSSVEHDFIRNI